MAYTTIDDPSAHFHLQRYTGDGNTNRDITNDANAGDFKPDLHWIKNLTSDGNNHILSISSLTNDGSKVGHLSTDLSYGEATATNKVTSFATDGFRIQNHSSVNTNSSLYMTWQWKANGGTTSSNSDGDITSTVQANTTAGFSIVRYTGNATDNATVGHGLGAVPGWIFLKELTAGDQLNWAVGHKEYMGESAENQRLSQSALASASSESGSHWSRTAPTSSVFTLGNGGAGDYSNETNRASNFIAMCWAPIQGYSKFSNYKGNGSTSGPFVYLGFKPAWLMIKAEDADEWRLYDNKRSIAGDGGFNPIDRRIEVHTDDEEYTADGGQTEMDFWANGFKIHSNSGGVNSTNQLYNYWAFAEHPTQSSKGVPATAR